MAILEASKIESNSGFQKVISAESMHMALDVLQKYQYQYPIKSTTRELAANAVDSIKERDIAKQILSGKAKVEDFYVVREGNEYKDSVFNPDYFDLKWLSDKKDVEIIYEEGDGLVKKDRFKVIDYGVGLGGSRLELYFKLNASTKRLSKSAIGKWGLGNKTPLSTGVDCFRMTSCWNGRKYSFDVYSHKVDSVTDKFNAKGELNPTESFSNGYTFYYEETTEKNHTEISFETKKHHRSQYTEAVRQQLLYFDNITYKIVREGGYTDSIATKATVIYEDDDIILSDNNQYSKPHTVIGNVSYGYVNFLELELEDKNGNIGIKMQAEDVDISPSRENILWTDKTRKAVTDKFNKVVEIASKEVEKQLAEKDFIKWLEKCSRVLSNNDSYSILGRLSRVIDKSAIKPTFPSDKTIKYKASPKEMLYGVNIMEVSTQSSGWGKTAKVSVTRENLTSWSALQNYQIYYTTGNANNLRDRYIMHTKSGRFIMLKEPEFLAEEEFKKDKTPITDTITHKVTSVEEQWQKYKSSAEYITKLVNLIKESPNSIDYETVDVPEDFKKQLAEAEKVEEDSTVTGTPIPELTPAEKRKLDERTVLYYPQKSTYDKSTTKVGIKPDGSTFTFNKRHDFIKVEPKISEVLAWEGDVIYCYGDEDEMLLTVAWIIEQQCLLNGASGVTNANFAYTDTVKLVRISKGIKKYFKNHTHVSEFFKKEVLNAVDDSNNPPFKKLEKELYMSNMMIKWFTAKRIADGLVGFEFLNNFSMFNQEISDKYQELRKYEKANYVSLEQYKKHGNMLGCTNEAFDAIVEYANNMADAQIALSKEEPNADGYTKIEAIDIDQYNLLQEVIEYATPLKNILNYIQPLTNITATNTINFELESEIKEIMRNKGYDS